MKKVLLVLVALLCLQALLLAANTKVAILPFEKMDRSSDYVVKMLNIRDLNLIFSKHSEFEVIPMKETKAEVANENITKIDEMDKDALIEMGNALHSDLVISGTVSSVDSRSFRVQAKIFSMRTQDISSVAFVVTKNKFERWDAMEKQFVDKVKDFVTGEMKKLLDVAVQQYDMNNNQAAQEGFLKIIAADPNNVSAYLYLGNIAYETKDYANAEMYLNKGLQLDPKNTKILQTLYSTYKDQEKTELSIATLSSLAENSNDAELWIALANLYADNGNNAKAAEALDRSLAQKKDNPKAEYRYGLLLYDQKDYTAAIPHLEKASNAYSDDDALAKKLAYAYQFTGKLKDAVAKYEQVAAANPTSVNAYLNLAGIYRAAAAEAADKKNPTEETSYNKKALATLNQLKVFAPDNSQMFLRFADVYFAMGIVADAENNANSAIGLDSSKYPGYLILAQINQKRGTDKYNQFVDLEASAAKAIGKKADALTKQRDAAKLDAYKFFKLADDELNTAKSKTQDAAVIKDINARIAALAPLLAQTKKGFF